MKPEQEKEYLEKYKKDKASGEKFWPDAIYKDLLVVLSVFLVLVLIASFIGVKPEPPADPSDFILCSPSRVVFPVPVPAIGIHPRQA